MPVRRHEPPGRSYTVQVKLAPDKRVFRQMDLSVQIPGGVIRAECSLHALVAIQGESTRRNR